jgi:hypothetical protein
VIANASDVFTCWLGSDTVFTFSIGRIFSTIAD